MTNANTKTFTAQVTSTYFVAGIKVREGTITKAAPIIGYIKGKKFRWLINYANTRGWRVNVVTGC